MIRLFRDGDIATSGTQFLEGPKETGEAASYRLKLFLGEYFLNIADGTPWFQAILGKTPQNIAEINIKQRLITTRGVAAISEFRFRTDRDDRRITVDAMLIDENSQLIRVSMKEEIS